MILFDVDNPDVIVVDGEEIPVDRFDAWWEGR